VGSGDGQGASEQNLANTRQRRGIAREPTAGITAWGLHGNAGEIDPPMRRAGCRKGRKSSRYAHRAARIGAKREIAGVGGHGRGRSARRGRPGTRPGAAGFNGVPSCAFLAENAERHFVGIVLPVTEAPASSRVCTAMRDGSAWGRKRGQSGLPPPVGTLATSIRSLTAKLRPASGPAAAPGTCARAGPAQKLRSKVMTLSGLARCPQARRRTRPWYRNAAD